MHSETEKGLTDDNEEVAAEAHDEVAAGEEVHVEEAVVETA
jgi:hypothetical protein